MQKILIIFSLFYGTIAHAQGTAGIFKFRWTIDSRLVNELVINNVGNSQLDIPRPLYDSVITRVKGIVSQEMHTDTRLLYPFNKRGKELMTPNTTNQVGNLPRGTKRQAMRTEYLEYYVKFRIRVDLMKTFSLGNQIASYSRLKPYVKVKMKVYGVDRRVKRRKKIRLGNFKSIGSFDINIGGTTVTNTNAIPIEEVLDMVFKGLDKFEAKVK